MHPKPANDNQPLPHVLVVVSATTHGRIVPLICQAVRVIERSKVDSKIIAGPGAADEQLLRLSNGIFTAVWLFGDEFTNYADKMVKTAKRSEVPVRYYGRPTSVLGKHLRWFVRVQM